MLFDLILFYLLSFAIFNADYHLCKKIIEISRFAFMLVRSLILTTLLGYQEISDD